jgi:glycine oxidase
VEIGRVFITEPGSEKSVEKGVRRPLSDSSTYDAICVGAGAIGLTIAHDLAEAGLRLALIDRGPVGREASWAGAGIIPPASLSAAKTPYDRLRAISYQRFREFSRQIAEDVGIDVGYRNCGAVEVFASPEEIESMPTVRQSRTRVGIEHAPLTDNQRQTFVAELVGKHVDWIPGVCQIRNPRFLAGMKAWLRQRGVTIIENDPAHDLLWGDRSRGRVAGVRLASERIIQGGQVLLAAGAWSGELYRRWTGIDLPIYPIQGEILVLQSPRATTLPILLQGKRYLVPRDDGLILVGSTEVNVGFKKRVTQAALEELRQFAAGLLPTLAKAKGVYSWAGLRPASGFSHPVLGRAEDINNLWIATGHFRHGVQQSPGTARLSDWMLGKPSFAAPEDFARNVSAESFHSPFQS